jgi:putative lipoprotein
MRTVRIALVALAAALLALPVGALAQATNRVTGTAVIRQRVALPNNAVVTFQLLDASKAGAAAVVLAEQKTTTNGQQAPFQFSLAYDPAKIQPNGVYILQGNIVVDGRLRYMTTSQYRVITGGNPTNITITLEPVGGTSPTPLPSTADGTTLLVIAAVLIGLVYAIRFVRPRLQLRD